MSDVTRILSAAGVWEVTGVENPPYKVPIDKGFTKDCGRPWGRSAPLPLGPAGELVLWPKRSMCTRKALKQLINALDKVFEEHENRLRVELQTAKQLKIR
jgi:hypothetical protein